MFLVSPAQQRVARLIDTCPEEEHHHGRVSDPGGGYGAKHVVDASEELLVGGGESVGERLGPRWHSVAESTRHLTSLTVKPSRPD